LFFYLPLVIALSPLRGPGKHVRGFSERTCRRPFSLVQTEHLAYGQTWNNGLSNFWFDCADVDVDVSLRLGSIKTIALVRNNVAYMNQGASSVGTTLRGAAFPLRNSFKQISWN
jgi:hypothetical protein